MATPLEQYLAQTPAEKQNAAMTSYVANLQLVSAVQPEIAAATVKDIDTVENTAAHEAERLFGADYAYVQPP